MADGVLASANKTLMEGGLIDTPMTWDNYEAVIDEVLTMNDKTLAAARKKMVRTIWEQAPSFKDSQLDLALYLSATKTDHDLEAALRLMQSYDPSMICGLVQLLTNADARQIAHEELKLQARTATISPASAPEDQPEPDPVLRFQRQPVHQRCRHCGRRCPLCQAGSAQLASGSKTLYDGVNTLNNGVSRLTDGATQLSDGLVQFNEEGISKLTGSLDTDQIHALKTVLDEMTSRLENYTSFAGAPEGASSNVKFIYKTGETVAAAENTAVAETTTQEGSFFTRLWERIVNLFKF